VFEAHDAALAAGGRPGITSLDLIFSAIGRPYNGYYRSISRKAAALTQSVAKNHGFADANKRTAIILTLLLIERSGYALEPLSGEQLDVALEEFVVSVVADNLSVDAIAAWYEARIVRVV
jgi:death-on-curing protein